MLEIQKFTFNPFEENTYVVSESDSQNCWVIDPGCAELYEENALFSYIETKGLKPIAVINTHCHIDHVLGNFSVCKKYNIPLWIGEFELPVLKSVAMYAPNYGFAYYQERLPNKLLKAGENIKIGNFDFEIRFVPGHSAGHIALIEQKNKVCIVGDVLFQRSIGRTDLPGGDYKTLINSIKTQLLSLSDDFKVYSGHGTETSIGAERKFNPFLN
jgi:glyoxylase-like metal-dependent hydrolase (beta-lactamase superfamily II)